jgi:hypothetical protein
MAHEVRTLRRVRSDDGTAIAFERAGEGPSLMLVGGAEEFGSERRPYTFDAYTTAIAISPTESDHVLRRLGTGASL